MNYMEPIISGTLTAITWAAIVFIVNFVRNKYLEVELKKSFKNISHFSGVQGWGIGLENQTGAPVKVRCVALIFADGSSYIPNFSGKKSVQRKVPLDIPGEKQVNIYTSATEFEDQKDERIIDLDFEMSGTWLLSNKSVLESKSYPIGGYTIIEYMTIFGGRRSIEVAFNNYKDTLKGMFERHKKECETNDFMKNNINIEEAQKKTRSMN